ncbi:MAG: hypothetical protein CBC42_07910 [Betaproteobacteria bacterium TMED82]|nr:MAG: hypothetical protein CBC42_07910 [Betaproteobacteria bacterium TMED82]
MHQRTMIISTYDATINKSLFFRYESMKTNKSYIFLLSIVSIVLLGTSKASANLFSIDNNHTSVTFEVIHYGVSTVRARFNEKQGTIFYNKKKKALQFDMSLKTGSVDSGITPFDNHLKSKDFFRTEEFPEIRLKSREITFLGDNIEKINASLEMLGKENTVTLYPERFGCYLNPRKKKEVCGGDFAFEIDRTLWGMNYGVPTIPKKVKILIQIEAVRN